MQNLFDTTSLSKKTEQTETIFEQKGMKFERIVSFGHPTPDDYWYDQTESEWVALLKGTALLEYTDGEFVRLNEGDHLTIPPHIRHRVKEVSDDAIWLALFLD